MTPQPTKDEHGVERCSEECRYRTFCGDHFRCLIDSRTLGYSPSHGAPLCEPAILERLRLAETERDELRGKLEEVDKLFRDHEICPYDNTRELPCSYFDDELFHCNEHTRQWLKLDAHGVGSDGGGVDE